MPSRKPIKGYVYIRKPNRGVDTGPGGGSPTDASEERLEEGLTDMGHDPTGGAGPDAMAADGGFVVTGKRLMTEEPGAEPPVNIQGIDVENDEAIARGADPSGGGGGDPPLDAKGEPLLRDLRHEDTYLKSVDHNSCRSNRQRTSGIASEGDGGLDPTGGGEPAALAPNEGFQATGRRRTAPGGGDHGNDPTGGGEPAALAPNEGFQATGRRRSAPGGGDHGNDPTGGGGIEAMSGGDHTGFLMFPKSRAAPGAGAGLPTGLAWQVPLLIVGLLVGSQLLGFIDVLEYAGDVGDVDGGQEEIDTPSELWEPVNSDDLDFDGVLNSLDTCPDTERGLLVDESGCPHFTEPLVNNGFRMYDVAELDAALLFFGSEHSGQTELYRWDGEEVVELRSDVDFGSFAFFVGVTENVAFFSVQGYGLWRTDGTWNGTYEVDMSNEDGEVERLRVECPCGTHGEHVYFHSGGPMRTIDIEENFRTLNYLGSQPRTMEPFGSGFLMTFLADQSIAYELYTAPFNGTNATLVKDIRPGQAYGMYTTGTDRATGFVHPQVIGDHGYFHTVSDGELKFWRTNGEENGTFVITVANGSTPIGSLRMPATGDEWKYFHPLPDGSFQGQENGTFLYQNNGALWRSDGTVNGEVLVEESLGYMGGFSDCGDGVLFLTSQGLHSTLGEQGSTTLLPINTPTLSPRMGAPSWSMCLEDRVLFTDTTGVPHFFDLTDLDPSV